jgi:hypothetical protein
MLRLTRTFEVRHACHLLLLSVLLVPMAAHAAWPSDPLQNVALCVTPFSSAVTAAVSDGRRGAIVAWYEDRAGDFDVFARRVDASGVPQWALNGVRACSTTAGTPQVLPKAVSDGANGVIMAWLDGRSGPNTLYLQRVDSSGTRLWGAGGVLAATTTSNQLTEFCLIADGAGGAVVTWTTPMSGVSSDIYAQRVNALGARQWGANALALCTEKSDQFRPMLVRKASGSFVVAWEDLRQLFRSDLYAQAITAAGVTQWAANGMIVANSADNAINPMLVATGANDCLLLWDADSLGVGDIRGQRLSSTGAALWAGAGVRMFSPGTNGLAAVTTDPLGGAYLVSSRTNVSTLKSQLWAQRVLDTGALVYPASGLRVSSIPSGQTQVAIAPDNAGGCMLTWYDDLRGVAPNGDIFAQRLSAAGVTLWSPSGVPVCSAPNTGPGLTLAADGVGGAVIAWSDTRNSPSPDLYVQGVDANGALGVGLGVEPHPGSATTALARPAPNPLPHGSTTISYTLSAPEQVTLRVVDATGRMVQLLEDGPRPSGTHTLAWDGRSNGRRLAPGIYLVQLLTPTRSEVRRLVLL